MRTPEVIERVRVAFTENRHLSTRTANIPVNSDDESSDEEDVKVVSRTTIQRILKVCLCAKILSNYLTLLRKISSFIRTSFNWFKNCCALTFKDVKNLRALNLKLWVRIRTCCKICFFAMKPVIARFQIFDRFRFPIPTDSKILDRFRFLPIFGFRNRDSDTDSDSKYKKFFL